MRLPSPSSPCRGLPRLAALVALSLLTALPGLGQGTAPAGEPTMSDPMVPVPESMTIRGIPEISERSLDALTPYENLRSAGFQDWHPTERRMLITTRFAETSQLHRVDQPLGARQQLTFFDEPVFGGSYRPERDGQILFFVNEGGAENYQIFLLDPEEATPKRISDGVHRHQSALWSKDGRWLAYTSNSRNGRDFDLYVMDPDRGMASSRRIAELSGAWAPMDWSHDGRHILLVNYISVNESDIYLLEVPELTADAAASPGPAEPTPVIPEDLEPQISYGGALFAADDRSLFLTTDREGEFTRLYRYRLDGGGSGEGDGERWQLLSGDIDWDVEGLELSEDGTRLVFTTNEDGLSKVHALNLETGAALATPDLPPGLAGGLSFRPGTHELALTLNWARSPTDVYSYDLAAENGELVRWTASEVGGLDTERFVIPELVRFPTFDRTEDGEVRTIPAFVYTPDPARHEPPYPVYLSIHGGPEGQFRPSFQGSSNFWIDELGIAVIYPNVRGSTGYGKSFSKLDNAYLREDSVKDIGALLDWIATRDDLDASRVMVAGGSYGGYMSLASMVHYGDRLKAGFEYVGISNFVTFLENTQAYRRDLRRVEYGDERDPEMRSFLEKISPLSRADEIQVPILIAQGANDPRVPLSEAEQIADAVAGNDIPVWYLVAADEGHGFAKKTNSDYLRAVIVEFMRRHLLDGKGSMADDQPAAP